MSMLDWAKKEVELACKKENPNRDGNCFDYGCSCYESALKAYESMLDDGHSGYSFSVTKNILIRLMNALPLTPITEDDFNDAPYFELSGDGTKGRQCPRMCSLFEETAKDGTITYNDVERYICYDVNDSAKTPFSMGCISRTLDELYPISLPYWPGVTKYKVFISHHYTDKSKERLSGVTIHYIITPEGERVELNKEINFNE